MANLVVQYKETTMIVYLIEAVRSGASMFGAAKGLAKGLDGEPKEFPTRKEAQAYCDKYNGNPNVRYSVVTWIKEVK
jgi:hypothetical protein